MLFHKGTTSLSLVPLCKVTYFKMLNRRGQYRHIRHTLWTKSLRLFPRQELLGVIFEEIVGEHRGDAEKQKRINAFLTEKLIHIGAVAIEFPCEPRHGTPLAAEFLFDEQTDVHHSRKKQKA